MATAAAHVIGNRILKSNCAPVNYCRFFSSNRFYHQVNDGHISGVVDSEKNREVQYEFKKLANGIGRKFDRLQDDVDILRSQMDEIIAHRKSEIEARREGEKIDVFVLRIRTVTFMVTIGVALYISLR